MSLRGGVLTPKQPPGRLGDHFAPLVVTSLIGCLEGLLLFPPVASSLIRNYFVAQRPPSLQTQLKQSKLWNPPAPANFCYRKIAHY